MSIEGGKPPSVYIGRQTNGKNFSKNTEFNDYCLYDYFLATR